MRFRATVKGGTVRVDIEAAACGAATAEFINRLSRFVRADISTAEKRQGEQGVSV